MDSLWLVIALVLGFAAQLLRLPPLVGFLLAGFTLNLLGEEGGELLDIAADFGVQLLLFTIGLKLRLKEFLTWPIWGGALGHMSASVLVAASFLLLLSLAGLAAVTAISWQVAALVGFALSFSSTVFAVKILEERGESRAEHAVLAIGILIVQDLAAVVFMLFAEGQVPSVWALILLALPLLRPVLLRALEASGHGEVLVLFGLAMTVLGGEVFYAVGMKDALGALVFGVLLSGHKKTSELAKSLLGFKDFFLLGFFLSIGLIGLPDAQDVVLVIALLLVLLPLKMVGYFWILTRFDMRARTAFLATLSLATFSEFGLIVADEGLSAGLLDARWLVVMALVVAGSFVVGSLLNTRAHRLYQRLEAWLTGFETQACVQDLEPADPGNAEVLIAGMGRVGVGAYRAMRENYAMRVIGVDADAEKVQRLVAAGMNVISGDAEDIEFWRQVVTPRLKLIMLALPTNQDMLTATRQLRLVGYTGNLGAVSRYDDERERLEEAGVDAAYNYYAEAGTGFADHIHRAILSGDLREIRSS
ncbi:MAG: cation:proton antiporter family protein [Gammaproteobacteria bacterium]|jgi:predicted Kef-type K+ transport protein|nr:cation:proton antiporter family protein [Gammaproteobacteria bacterium]